METEVWVIRCAGRLHQQWPTIPLEDLKDTAAQLAADAQMRKALPENAATWWLEQGVLAP